MAVSTILVVNVDSTTREITVQAGMPFNAVTKPTLLGMLELAKDSVREQCAAATTERPTGIVGASFIPGGN